MDSIFKKCFAPFFLIFPSVMMSTGCSLVQVLWRTQQPITIFPFLFYCQHFFYKRHNPPFSKTPSPLANKHSRFLSFLFLHTSLSVAVQRLREKMEEFASLWSYQEVGSLHVLASFGVWHLRLLSVYVRMKENSI